MKEKQPSYLGFCLSLLLIYKKDSLGQYRRPLGLVSSLLFSIILATLYSYALKTKVFFDQQNFEGIVLASLFFSSTLTASQSLGSEREFGALRILNMSFLDPAGVYIGKVIAHWQSQLIFIGVCLPIYFLLLLGTSPSQLLNATHSWSALFIGLSLSALSLSALAVLLSYVSLEKSLQSLFMPLLLLPLSLPILILSLHFLGQAGRAESLFDIELGQYLILIAPFGLYAGTGALVYFKLVVDAA